MNILTKDECDRLMSEGKQHYDAGRVFQAIDCLKKIILLEHGHLGARSALISCYGLVGEMTLLIGILRDTADLYPAALPYTSAYLFCLNYFNVSRAVRLSEHRKMMVRVEKEILAKAPPKLIEPTGRKLRIGYVSGDFREHSCAYLTFPLLRNHNRNEFDIYLYSNNPDNDRKTEEFHRLGEWRDIRTTPDAEAARIVRQDKIDILVDLSGHTIAGRTSLFFHRPAPIQISWYGYLNTIGTVAIPYRITDPFLSPENANNEQWYVEKLLRIPRSFLYEPPLMIPPVAAAPYSRNGFFTFGALHNIKKVSDDTLDLWCEILKATPRSKILVSTEFGGDIETVLRKRFAERGVGPTQLIMAKDEPIEQFFSFFERIDLMLDTFPYTSGVSAMHGIWMGTPTLTIEGDTELGRNCAAVNRSYGIPEYVAPTKEEFISRAIAFASNPSSLTEFRRTCRLKPVVDNSAVVRSLELLYRTLTQGQFTAESSH